jgi:hypothetical protein
MDTSKHIESEFDAGIPVAYNQRDLLTYGTSPCTARRPTLCTWHNFYRPMISPPPTFFAQLSASVAPTCATPTRSVNRIKKSQSTHVTSHPHCALHPVRAPLRPTSADLPAARFYRAGQRELWCFPDLPSRSGLQRNRPGTALVGESVCINNTPTSR